ncbi:YheC/YheD family protein [Bacillus sp. Marseille-Q3570]|uniref:YheC/YheD family endospore coat-associated protein n=1 Tax=Bacillus sp. Marseille-Q3570 TaxID=2963522 RepID=UPI0021B78EC2|nr:YheC/YheD family protein [Bacillus sp. Marseille-Q3570]
MISISWDVESEKWHHHEKGQTLIWGAADDPLPFSAYRNSSLNLTLIKKEGSKAGPIVGILTSAKASLPFIGNIDTFIRLISCVHENGGLAVVFSSKDISSTSISGYTYDLNTLMWKRVRTPPPDFVYNRIPYKKDENKEFHRLLSWLDDFSIPYFNLCFFQKWDTYLILNDNTNLQPFLPETKLIHSKKQLEDFLIKHGQILIKPSASSKGKGIFTIEQKKSGGLLYHSNNRRIRIDLSQIWKILQYEKNFIMQPFIQRKTYQGRPFDYRILVQKIENKWHVTGYGIRCAGVNRLTTHVPAGGALLSSDFAPLHLDTIRNIASETGSSLDRSLGPVGEFSIDLGVDTEQQSWIFEINSKPMIFDEIEIQMQALRNWYQQILEMSGFPRLDIKDPPLTHTSEKGG